MSTPFRRALRDSVPVLAGYVFLGIGFGILLVAEGYPFWLPVLMSAVVYAGSAQYLAVNLLTAGASLVTTALMTLAINARHFFYGLAMLARYRDMGKAKPYLIFSLTDETFSLVCRDGAAQGPDAKRYYLFVSLLDHFYWIAGTLIGSLLGTALPFDFSGIEFAMTALFVVIFIDQWRAAKQHFPALLGVGVSVLCLVLFGPSRFIIPSMIGIAAGLLLYRRFAPRKEERQ